MYWAHKFLSFTLVTSNIKLVTKHLFIQKIPRYMLYFTSISNWCSQWLLSLNIFKCIVVHFCNNNPLIITFELTVTIMSIDNDLGVKINSRLSWSDHTALVYKLQILFLFCKTSSNLSVETSSKLYSCYVCLILEYTSVV